MHLACLEMRVARMNFDLTYYVVWLSLRLSLPRGNKAKQNKLFVSGNPPVPKKRCRVSKFYSFLVENKIFIDIPCLLFDKKISETLFILF